MNETILTPDYWVVVIISIIIVYAIMFGLLHLMQYMGLREVTRALHEQTRALGMIINDNRQNTAEQQSLLQRIDERVMRCESVLEQVRRAVGSRAVDATPQLKTI